MKLKLAKNSLFAVLLRSRWWVSLSVAMVLALLAVALLPQAYKLIGALSATPFFVLAAMAAWRQRGQPSPAQVEQATKSLSAMNWQQFSERLERAFQRDGFAVQRSAIDGVDFQLERKGRVMLVSARRWKSARLGVEVLRTLQQAREKAQAPDALLISLGVLTDQARPYAAQQRIAVWQAAELAQCLRRELKA